MNVILKNGAANSLAELCSNYKNILYVADKNTYKAFGREFDNILIFDVPLVPNEEAIEKLTEKSQDSDLIVGIGSGVINDLCKYVSFKKGIPYYICATAPSMDGYVSTGSALIIGGMKITYTTHTPDAIIADIDILKNAPFDLIRAGYGDIIGKFSALNDWELSNLVTGEKLDTEIYNKTKKAVDRVIDLRFELNERTDESIYALTDALILVGIAMMECGNSRPASGSEHHLSHFFEITGLLDNTEYLPHGIDVAYSTIVTAELRKRILENYEKPDFDRAHWEKRVKEIYSTSAEGIIELQDKVGLHGKDFNVDFEKIRKILKKHPSGDEIYELLKPMGYDIDKFINLYGIKKITDAVYYAKDLKDRYTVLWLLEEK